MEYPQETVLCMQPRDKNRNVSYAVTVFYSLLTTFSSKLSVVHLSI